MDKKSDALKDLEFSLESWAEFFNVDMLHFFHWRLFTSSL